jgi:hypothetical protein
VEARSDAARLRVRGVAEIGFKAVSNNANALAFYGAVGAGGWAGNAGRGGRRWQDIIFALATDAPAAFRRT